MDRLESSEERIVVCGRKQTKKMVGCWTYDLGYKLFFTLNRMRILPGFDVK